MTMQDIATKMESLSHRVQTLCTERRIRVMVKFEYQWGQFL